MTSKEVFSKFVPHGAVDYCNELYEKLGFEFKIKRARMTKLGDYKYWHRSGRHVISINNDLNPYAFLITYLHEVAHLLANKAHGFRIQPHGEEWKHHFKTVSAPLLNEQVFDGRVLIALNGYFKDPKASSCADPVLYQTLREFDSKKDRTLLRDLPIGTYFVLNNKTFEKLERKRTRVVCREVLTKKKYLIAGLAEISRRIN